MAIQADAARRRRRPRPGRARARALRLGARVVALRARRHHHLPHPAGGRGCRARRLVHRPAALLARQRRTGCALPRRARALAAGRDRQRHRSQPAGGDEQLAALAAAGRAPGRIGRRQGRGNRLGPQRRAFAPAFVRRDVRHHRHRRGGALLARSEIPAPRPLGSPRRLAQRAGGSAVPHRRDAGQRQRAARRRSDDHRHARRFRGRSGLPDGAQEPRRAVRADAARPQREQQRAEQVRRHAVRSGGADRVLRRERTRDVTDLHAEGRRSAVRAEARARAALSRLYRAGAAQDRGRRRPRGAEGHRGPRQGDADDDRQGRTDPRERRPEGGARGGRRRPDGCVHGQQGRLLSLRARRADRRTSLRIAAVHHRRALGSGADRLDCQAGPRHQRLPDRRGAGRSAGGR